MSKLTRAGIRRIVSGWAALLIGLAPLLWLHTFRDNGAHQVIGPLFLLLWIILLVFVWEGCKSFRLQLRYILLTAQVAASVILCRLFFQRLIEQSV